MSDEKETTTRIYEKDRDKLNQLSSEYGMKVSIVLGHIIDIAKKYKVLDRDWIENLVQKEVSNYLKDQDVEFRKKLELKKLDSIQKAQMLIFKEWLGILEPTEKKKFLEDVMGVRRGADFLERLSNYQLFMIDGEKRLYAPDAEGYPEIPYTDKLDIIKCVRGFHIRLNRCDCRRWQECEHGAAAYENYLAANGSDLERKRYLEETTGQKLFFRRN